MPLNPERIQRIRGFGLTEYQARVYLALLDLGATPAARIPALARVPRSRVYAILQQLNEKGLTQILPERPRVYRPVPIASFLRTAVQEERRHARRIEASIEDVARDFRIRGDVLPPERGRFEAIYGRWNVSVRTREMISRARREVVGIGTSRTPWRLVRALGNTLREKGRAGVPIEFAVPVTPDNREDVRVLGGFARVRSIDLSMPVVLHAVDGSEFLLSHPIPDDNSPNRGEDIAIWTDDPAIASAMLRIVKRIWKSATPVSLT